MKQTLNLVMMLVVGSNILASELQPKIGAPKAKQLYFPFEHTAPQPLFDALKADPDFIQQLHSLQQRQSSLVDTIKPAEPNSHDKCESIKATKVWYDYQSQILLITATKSREFLEKLTPTTSLNNKVINFIAQLDSQRSNEEKSAAYLASKTCSHETFNSGNEV